MRFALPLLALLIVATPHLAMAEAMTETKPAPLDEFRRVSVALGELSRYVVDIEIRYGDWHGQQMRGRVSCDGQGRCLRALGILRVLETPRWLIAVDDSHRTISIMSRAQTAPLAVPPISPDEALATWLSSGGEVSGGGLTSFGRHWIFAPANPTMPRAEIYTDPDTHLLNRLVYESTEPGGRVEIQYKWRDATQVNPAELAETQFIVERGEQITAADTYANYTLVRKDLH